MPIINTTKTVKPMSYEEFSQKFKDTFAQSKMQCSQKIKQNNPKM